MYVPYWKGHSMNIGFKTREKAEEYMNDWLTFNSMTGEFSGEEYEDMTYEQMNELWEIREVNDNCSLENDFIVIP